VGAARGRADAACRTEPRLAGRAEPSARCAGGLGAPPGGGDPPAAPPRVRMRLRSEAGFGLIELLMAMVILNIGILAIVAAFSSSQFALNRASKISTASALADSQMELFRAIKNDSIALDATARGPGHHTDQC